MTATDEDERVALAAQALDARRDGKSDQAAALWKRLLRRWPQDWRSALELGNDLRAVGQYPEAHAAFRRATVHFPDPEWVRHYATLFAFHHDHLDALDQRARSVLRRNPDDPQLQQLLGDIAWQRRDLATAEEAYAACPTKRETVRRYRRLARQLEAAPQSGDRYGIALLNLDHNAERLAEIERQFRGCPVPLRRIPGVNGAALPHDAVRQLVNDPAGAPRGTLGCFLSHELAWRTMLAEGLPHCLVIEDDVMPLLDLPARLGPLGLPDGYDLCFVNDRIQPPRTAAELAATDGFHALPLPDAMLAFPPEDNAPGADGYLVSAAGARKLLAWVEGDKRDDDVDWRLLAYGLTPEGIAALPRHGHAWAKLDGLQHLVPRTERLRAYVLSPALIRTVPVSSDREDTNCLALVIPNA